MNVIFGWEAYHEIGDKYTRLELHTLKYPDVEEPVTLFAIAGPDDVKLEQIVTLKQFIPIHEALMENYQGGNWAFCQQCIGHLKGNINEFMDEFYAVLLVDIIKAEMADDPDWNHVKIIEKA